MKALIQCPACNAQISREAESCPQCGHPVKVHKNRSSLIVGVIIILVAIYCVWSAISNSEKSAAAADKAQQEFEKPISSQSPN